MKETTDKHGWTLILGEGVTVTTELSTKSARRATMKRGLGGGERRMTRRRNWRIRAMRVNVLAQGQSSRASAELRLKP